MHRGTIPRVWDFHSRAQRFQRWLAQPLEDVVCGAVRVVESLPLQLLDKQALLVETLHRRHHLRVEVGSTGRADSFFACPVESRARDTPVAGHRARARTCRCPREVSAIAEKQTNHKFCVWLTGVGSFYWIRLIFRDNLFLAALAHRMRMQHAQIGLGLGHYH